MKTKVWIPISELKQFYLIDCESNPLDLLLCGKLFPVKPSLIGWIKYWRETVEKYPDWQIIYPSYFRKLK